MTGAWRGARRHRVRQTGTASSRGNIRCTWTDSRGRSFSFRSLAERRYAMEVVEILYLGGIITDWEYERSIPLVVMPDGKILRRHLIDFALTFPDGHTEFHEVKGYMEDHWQIKADVLLAHYLPQHPDISYHVIDSRSLKSKTWRS